MAFHMGVRLVSSSPFAAAAAAAEEEEAAYAEKSPRGRGGRPNSSDFGPNLKF